MEPVHEKLKAADRKREIFCEVVELLEEAGLLTGEEKNCIKNMIWQENVLKRM